MERKRILALVAGALLATVLGFAIAATFYGDTAGTTHWDANKGPEITAVDVEIENDTPIQEGVVDFGHTRFESNGNTSAWIRDHDQNFINLTNVTADQNDLSVHSSRPTITIGGNASRIRWRDYDTDDGLDDLDIAPGTDPVDILLTELPADSYVRVMNSSGGLHDAAYVNQTGSTWVEISEEDQYHLQTDDLQSDVFKDEYPPDGTELTDQSNIPLNITVDPPTDGAHSVTFRNATDDSIIGTDTVQDSGEASTTWSNPTLGYNDWYVSINNTVNSSAYEFATPADVEIRDETDQSLLDGQIKVTVQFFYSGEEVLEKTTTNGKVDLTGLPPNEMLIIDAAENTSDYYSRRIILPSIAEQGTIYLLPTTATSHTSKFVLDDRTGEFDSEGTRLFIERPITIDGNKTYVQLAADRFGADDAFTQELEAGVRYQLKLRNDNNQTRQLGHYVPEQDEVIELTVGELEWELSDETADVRYDTERFEHEGDDYLRLQLNDSAGLTENVRVVMYETGNRSNRTIYDETHPGPFGNLVATQKIPESAENVSTWTIEWEGEREGETISGENTIGAGQYPVPINAPQPMIAAFAALMIVFVGGMFSVRVATVGVVILPIFALGLWAINWLPLPLSWVLAAMFLGVGAEFARRGGFSYHR